MAPSEPTVIDLFPPAGAWLLAALFLVWLVCVVVMRRQKRSGQAMSSAPWKWRPRWLSALPQRGAHGVDAPRLVGSLPLTGGVSVHVIAWRGRQRLIVCSPQTVLELDQHVVTEDAP